MPVKLANHIRPFSHTPGEICMVPRSSWAVQAYPALICLQPLTLHEEKIVISIGITGPIDQFTIMQDLERDFVRVFGIAREGYFALRLTASTNELSLNLERCPKKGIVFSFRQRKKRLYRKEKLLFSLSQNLPIYPKGRIHFGCHKKQDWTLVKRRLSLKEILPIWFALGRKYPEEPIHFDGTAGLLKECKIAIEKRNRLEVGSLFIKLFQVGFTGMLTPRLADNEFQGILPNGKYLDRSPFILLSYGSELIQKMFLDHQGDELFILPCLPIELHAGQCRDMFVSQALSIDFEWSKKIIRRIKIRSHIDQILKLRLQKDVQSFRFEGKRVEKNTLLTLKTGKIYLFDRFQK